MAELDLLIRGATVVDGTGATPRRADVAVSGGRVVEVGRVRDGARREIDADGALVTPGFVDIHTHYDGQATWDPRLQPSSGHGVDHVRFLKEPRLESACGLSRRRLRHEGALARRAGDCCRRALREHAA